MSLLLQYAHVYPDSARFLPVHLTYLIAHMNFRICLFDMSLLIQTHLQKSWGYNSLIFSYHTSYAFIFGQLSNKHFWPHSFSVTTWSDHPAWRTLSHYKVALWFCHLLPLWWINRKDLTRAQPCKLACILLATKANWLRLGGILT